MVHEAFCAFSDTLIVRDQHSSFTGRHILRGIERETRNITEGPYRLSLVRRSVSLCTILDERNIVFVGDIDQLVHVTRKSVQVYCKNRVNILGFED
jgi:hypothetical protein